MLTKNRKFHVFVNGEHKTDMNSGTTYYTNEGVLKIAKLVHPDCDLKLVEVEQFGGKETGCVLMYSRADEPG